ncbi:MAG: helix-turn-helix transcriptional regulator [Gemmatimonadales bacterium]
MPTTTWNARFFATSRGRIVELLRREGQTVEALARALKLTTNAVRGHLAVLERDGMVRSEGVRRGVGKPAQIYGLTAAAELHLSQAYAPVFRGLLDELGNRLNAAELEALLRATGRRLAPRRAAPGESRGARIAAAQRVLAELGGSTELTEEEGESTVISGAACPLAEVVADHPVVCCGLETLLAEVTGLPVQERCDRDGSRPRCRFVVGR